MSQAGSKNRVLAGTYFPLFHAQAGRGAVGFSGFRPPCCLSEQVSLSWICRRIFDKALKFGTGSQIPPPPLTKREIECLSWIAAGKTSYETAQILNLSEHTINHYLLAICNKLGAANRIHAVTKAFRLGIID
ncbi:hypothetical protein CSC94_23465 [Zhengella mangrovi]|uniref:HTH luxR-type domain-containing protein n=1 Tax=Zhengella mangrovi TaxID=1982044 RepID=A0A2G1QGL5_9HYPH|nr:hypothetical protein CSC94_23465 [Zhengella mangrovi]